MIPREVVVPGHSTNTLVVVRSLGHLLAKYHTAMCGP